MSELPKSYEHLSSETKWAKYWEEQGTYRWDPNSTRGELFVVDTPPPTISGALHVGHVFSYTQTDVITRYQRMIGKKIFYPMGWDDNGLPTERRVQNKFNIRCNPHLPFDPNWVAEPNEDKHPREISRKNFIDSCAIVTKEDEAAFEALWRRLGLSIDWSQQYATIDKHCRRVSQLSFLDLVNKGLVYNAESPTMWDVDFRTALAQADLEDRVRPGAFHDIRFGVEGGGEFIISTTRPELLAACIAVVAHPTDQRYQGLFGKMAVTPLFKARVPICPSEHADPEKGSGIMMICTFGDIADVEWWKASKLPIKQILGQDGRLLDLDFTREPFTSLDPAKAATFWAELKGLKTEQAKKKIAELLAQVGSGALSDEPALVGAVKPVEHPVKFYEKGERPIEFITTRQWFVRLLDYKKELLAQGAKINWFPAHMKARYDNWVEGLNHDWCISRQRFFGVSFPVWYPVDAAGNPDYTKPIYAEAKSLPVDPLSDIPPGYSADQRGKPNGFVGDPDVMDTWATSSLTPQLMSHWGTDSERHQKLFPMDIRPQAHEIIRTWAFYTIVKAWMHSNEIPWKNIVISGWILDPDRKKMSKSKGNVVTPDALLTQYSSDAVRYWAARARLGVDTAYDEKVFKIGQKLTVKIFNASRFVHGLLADKEIPPVTKITQPLDLSLVSSLAETIDQATAAFERFEYAQALQLAESAFWSYCDNYLELVKVRAYSAEDRAAQDSALATLAWSLKTFLRLFAPVTPYVTEEVWSWRFAEGNGSIHQTKWPSSVEVKELLGSYSSELLETAAIVLAAIQREKTRNQKSLGSPLATLVIEAPKAQLPAVELVAADISKTAKLTPGTLPILRAVNETPTPAVAVSLEFAEEAR